MIISSIRFSGQDAFYRDDLYIQNRQHFIVFKQKFQTYPFFFMKIRISFPILFLFNIHKMNIKPNFDLTSIYFYILNINTSISD